MALQRQGAGVSVIIEGCSEGGEVVDMDECENREEGRKRREAGGGGWAGGWVGGRQAGRHTVRVVGGNCL